MNASVRATFERVANGTADRKDMTDFKVSARALGWEGVKSGGVYNHIEGARVRGWAALAQVLLESNKREELEDVEEAEAAETEADEAATADTEITSEPMSGTLVYLRTERTTAIPFRTERVVTHSVFTAR